MTLDVCWFKMQSYSLTLVRWSSVTGVMLLYFLWGQPSRIFVSYLRDAHYTLVFSFCQCSLWFSLRERLSFFLSKIVPNDIRLILSPLSEFRLTRIFSFKTSEGQFPALIFDACVSWSCLCVIAETQLMRKKPNDKLLNIYDFSYTFEIQFWPSWSS